MRPLIYVAGPLGVPEEVGWDKVRRNQHRAYEAAMRLVHAGWSPVVPHQNASWPDAFDVPHATWLEVDEPLLRACQAIVRLPGDSKGADHEVIMAHHYGIRQVSMKLALEGPEKALKP